MKNMLKKEDIIQFKAKGLSYISSKDGIEPIDVYNAFYGARDDKTYLGTTYCSPYVYEVSRGDFNYGLKYSYNDENYYMFIGANSEYAPPQTISVGKAKDGLIYLIWENVPDPGANMQLRIISEEYVNKNEPGFRPTSYRNFISACGPFEKRVKQLNEIIADRDVQCVEIALEGITVFSKLIKDILSNNHLPRTEDDIKSKNKQLKRQQYF